MSWFKLRHRGRKRVGPWTFNWSPFKGITSVTTRLGPLSRNSRRTGAGLDLPGGFHADLGERRRR